MSENSLRETSMSDARASEVPYVDAEEAHELLKTELVRFLALVEDLGDEDWSQPTACSEWSVRDILAHQAGSYASGTGYREMLRQYAVRPQAGQLPEDAVNAKQLRERAHKSPQELIEEVRAHGPDACRKWAREFRLIKPIGLPHPEGGTLTLRHLMWVIHSRDTWMHRLDICRATDRPFEQTPGHDGRIVALVMRDVSGPVERALDGRGATFDLSGPTGGRWRVGSRDPEAVIAMDALDFNIFASGRFSLEEAQERAKTTGDAELANTVLANARALY